MHNSHTPYTPLSTFPNHPTPNYFTLPFIQTNQSIDQLSTLLSTYLFHVQYIVS